MCKIEFRTDNAAFREEDEDGGDRLCFDEVATVVRGIADKIADGFTSGPVMDTNGNCVGDWSLDD